MQKVINDSIISSIFQFLKIGARFFIGIYLVKQLEVEEYGAYNLFMLFISFGSVILSLNTHEYFNIEISSSKSIARKHRFFWSIMELLLLLSICFFLLLHSEIVSTNILRWLHIEHFSEAYTYVLLVIIITTISMTIARYAAYSKYVLFFQSWTFFLQTMWIVPLFFMQLNIKNIFFSQLVSIGVLSVIGIYYIYKKEKRYFLFKVSKILPDKTFIKSAVAFGFGTYFALIGSFFLEITDKVMLAVLSSNDNVAYYSFASITFNIINGFIVGTVLIIAMPYINRFHSSDKEKKFAIYVELIKGFIIYLSGMLLIISLLADKIVLFLGKEEYLQTAMVFPVVSLVFLTTLIINILRHELMLQQLLKKLSIIFFSALAINAMLNLYFIPNYFYMGAFISTLITQVYIVIQLYRNTDLSRYVVFRLKTMATLVSILGIVYGIYFILRTYLFINMTNETALLFLMLIILYVIYLFLLYFLDIIPPKHLEVFKKVVLKRGSKV